MVHWSLSVSFVVHPLRPQYPASMKGYLAFPPQAFRAIPSAQQLKVAESTGACTPWSNCHGRFDTAHPRTGGNAEPGMEGERRKRSDLKRELGERSEIEWVRAGGVLRDAFGRRDKVRTEKIRQELRTQDEEKEKAARGEAYEARWHQLQSSSSPVAFAEFPWPLKERISSRDLGPLTRRAVSEFLFESLEIRTNTTTKRDRIRGSFLRWHPDKMSTVLGRVLPDDLELVQEGIHIVFGILKVLKEAERTGTL